MTLKEMKDWMAKTKIEIERAIDEDLPKRIGNRVVRMTKQNFQEEGFFGKRWKEVKRRQPRKGRSKRTGSDQSRKILTGRTGDLGRSIKAEPQKGSVIIHSDLPYSAAHNEGTSTAGRKHNTRIPKRQFLGEHPKVRQAVNETIEKEIKKILNK